MGMRLQFAKGTTAYLRTLAPRPRQAIRKALRLLEDDPRHPGLTVKQLDVVGDVRLYRVRVGDYRIVFTPAAGQTFVWRIFHRSEGYGWLERRDLPRPERGTKDRQG